MSAAQEPPHPETPSSVFARLAGRGGHHGRYHLGSEIARGGMGAIHEVWDEDLRRTLAMKVALARAAAGANATEAAASKSRQLDRFLEEAQITGQLDHPGIVPVHELGLDSEGRLYFTMRLVKGRDLEAIFGLVRRREEGWTLTRALGVMLKVCEAMAFAHEKGVIHRDLKPANVMVGRFGETYVMDWGLARVLGKEDAHDMRLRETSAMRSIVRTDRAEERAADSSLVTMDGDIVGTPSYMAPEQARGRLEDIGPHSDVYSAGAMLYQLLTGQPPFVQPGERIGPHAVLGLLLEGPPTSVRVLDRTVSDELASICERAMAREPRQRYATMLEMAEDLRAFLEDRVVRAHQTGPVAEFRKWIRRNKGAAAASAAAVLLAVVGLTTVVLVQSRSNERLRVAKEDVEEARDDALAAQKDLEAANTDLGIARDEADEQARQAQQAEYAANVAAASASLRLADTADARRRLEACDESRRGWEWHHLALAADPSVRDLGSGSADVVAVAYHPSGELLATTSRDGLLRLIRAADGELLHDIELPHGLPDVLAFTADGTSVASSGRDRAIHMWSVESGAETGVFGDHGGAITDVVFSPDGTHAATAAADKLVRVWDLASGELLHELVGHQASVTSVAFGRGGALLASGSRDRTVRLWDVRSGEALRVFSDPEHSIAFVAFDRDGSRLVGGLASSAEQGGETVARGANTVRMWSVEQGSLLGVFSGASLQLSSGGFDPSDRWIYATSLDSTVWLWDLRTGRDEVLLGHAAAVLDAAYSPDGTTLATAGMGGETKLWVPELRLGLPLRGHAGALNALVFTSGGERLVGASNDFTLRAWSTRHGLLETVFRGHEQVVLDVAVSPDGATLASTGADATVRLWDAASARELSRIGEPRPADLGGLPASIRMQRVAFHPGGRWLAVSRGKGEIVIWDVVEQASVSEIHGSDGYPEALAWSPDGERILAATRGLDLRNYTLEQWNRQDGRLVARRDALPGVGDVAFAPDGALAVSIGDTVRFLSPEDLSDLRTLVGHEEFVGALAFTPDSRRLASGSSDDTIRIWEVESGETLLTLRSPGQNILDLAFGPDATELAVAYADGSALLLCTNPAAEREAARSAEGVARRAELALLDDLFETFADPELVAERLRNDPGLDPARLRTAAGLARLVATDPEAASRECWRAVRVPGQPEEDVHLALWSAFVADRIEPDDERTLRLLGAAQYRLEKLGAAVESLERSLALRRNRSRVEVLALLAMVHHRLGHAEASDQAHLEVLALMQIPSNLLQPEHQALLREAEEVRRRPSDGR